MLNEGNGRIACRNCPEIRHNTFVGISRNKVNQLLRWSAIITNGTIRSSIPSFPRGYCARSDYSNINKMGGMQLFRATCKTRDFWDIGNEPGLTFLRVHRRWSFSIGKTCQWYVKKFMPLAPRLRQRGWQTRPPALRQRLAAPPRCGMRRE